MNGNLPRTGNTIKKAVEPEVVEKEKKQFKLKPIDMGRSLPAIYIVLVLGSVFMFFAFTSFLFTGPADQSLFENPITDPELQTLQSAENLFGYIGAWLAYIFVFKGLGLGTFALPPILFIVGIKNLLPQLNLNWQKYIPHLSFWGIFLSFALSSILILSPDNPFAGYFGGMVGFHIGQLIYGLLGWGYFLLIIVAFLVYGAIGLGLNLLVFTQNHQVTKTEPTSELQPESTLQTHLSFKNSKNKLGEQDDIQIEEDTETEIQPNTQTTVTPTPPTSGLKMPELVINNTNPVTPTQPENNNKPEITETTTNLPITEEPIELIEGEEADFDPRLELSDYRNPTTELLKEHSKGQVSVSNEDLQANIEKIVKTLNDFGITIDRIFATPGPTVTLFEIVPSAGIKISKIKSIEDDIALNLAAFGIRIIAPIPGKGTVGIEVPNSKREIVSLKGILESEEFINSKHELPIVLGKTIQNTAFIADLTKMPHLLMAGTTGSGKSVGINVVLTSLMYRKHPAELKFVLVDPKRVELSIYEKIEKHMLAKLPGASEAIITDVKKVIHTLNSLVKEMDDRLELLKLGSTRNILEYNDKFKKRMLNPLKGHRFLPYIVLVIDELADLMMTAGKEVETPIARLAQMARAAGIHIIVATQRPSVNVITGIIKANFPARVAFRVISKIDSRTILDQNGADQLIGYGDMLYSAGSDLIRLQCPFIDTSEVNAIGEYIAQQRSYATAYELPTPDTGSDDESGQGTLDLSERDSLFNEAARIIVSHQQGSTSLLQRRMNIGFNRAGRLMDQLEMAGIVGPANGSKTRDVLITDLNSLEQLLR